MMLREKNEGQMIKYLWYSIDCGLSNDFDTEEECISDAYRENMEYPSEYGIYSYESLEHSDGKIDIDDCDYIGFIGGIYNSKYTDKEMPLQRTIQNTIPI